MKTLIIAEKPSVAQSIASALGANKREDGYFSGNGYLVSFAFGHLYTLADTADYNPDMESWDLKYYPFIPESFRYKGIDDKGVKKQIGILKDLVKQADVVINACDGDREGELIFAELKNDLKIKKPIKRLWITSHTPKDIEKGMASLKDDMKNLEKAGYCRQQVDWIIGINLTVVYTLKAGGEYTLKVGRVVLPTLKLIFDREEEIANFKSVPFYMLKSQFSAGDESYVGTYRDKEGKTRLASMELLQLILNSVLDEPGIITKKESKQSKSNAPKLFNLTDLQGHMTSKYQEFTSDLVLDVMQSLYEKKYLTYPRTASRYLDDSQIKNAEESLNAVAGMPELQLKKSDVAFHTDKRVFDSSKVDSHPAIIPTYITPELSKLSDNEKLVYLEVVKRFVAQFMPAAVYDNLELVTKVDEYEFVTKGKVLVEEGWKQLYINQEDLDDDNSEGDQEQDPEDKITAKNLQEGDKVNMSAMELAEGKTKPPAHYTEKTLLAAMENCGRLVDNEDDVLKGFTIGTPATRGDTIKKLLDSGYIYTKGKNLLITDLGAKLIHFFPVKRLLKVDFTGQIEKTLKDIENGQYDSDTFMDKMKSFITKNVEEMKNSEIPVIKKPINILGICPDCKKKVVETDLAYSCEGTRDSSCKFTLWKDNKFFKHYGKRLTETIAKDLVNNKKVFVKGLKSTKKEGVKFDSTITIVKDNETGYWNFQLDFTEAGSASKNQPKKQNIKFKKASQ
jgi:DNA topoisomerase-3